MSKKDYIKFAEMIKERHDYLTEFLERSDIREDVRLRAEGQQVESTYFARAMADIFQQDNPQFNRRRFLVACGVEN